MEFFENFPEFVEEDARKDRGYSRLTFESLNKRHMAMAPKWLVEDMTVLDLGSCLGATGHWVLSQGASEYTGVEVQPDMALKSEQFLSKYWNQNQFKIVEKDIREFLDDAIRSKKKYDVIIMIGVIYAFLDTYNIVQKLAKLSSYAVVIDSLYPWYMQNPDVPIIHIQRTQGINTQQHQTAYIGAGARPSPNALRIMMGSNGFEDKEGLIIPPPLSDKTTHDSYSTPVELAGIISTPLPARYLMRFYNTNEFKQREVADNVAKRNEESKGEMAKQPRVKEASGWVFDDAVAERFQDEAVNHIPDYQRVIDLGLDVTRKVFKENEKIKIIDVGSALGHTMQLYSDAGYTEVYGVDNSPQMIERSMMKDKVILSDQFPDGDWNVVLCNWTLHFIREKEEYLQSIFNNMADGGLLMLTDKMDHTEIIEKMYHDFKRANGISSIEIDQKKNALIGVMLTKPLSWYMETLKKIGFTDIQVINNKFMFNTIYARKL